jgi:hypothetical protein
MKKALLTFAGLLLAALIYIVVESFLYVLYEKYFGSPGP